LIIRHIDAAALDRLFFRGTPLGSSGIPGLMIVGRPRSPQAPTFGCLLMSGRHGAQPAPGGAVEESVARRTVIQYPKAIGGERA